MMIADVVDVLQVVESCLSDVGSARHHHMESSKNDVVMTDLNAVEATAARDTLCKHLYHRLFTWIVNSINDKVKVGVLGYTWLLGVEYDLMTRWNDAGAATWQT